MKDILRSGDAGHNVAINANLDRMRIDHAVQIRSEWQFTVQWKGQFLPGWHQGKAVVRDILE